jgi:hypothetical protein
MAYTVTDDEEFAAFAKRAEEEAAQQNKSGSSFTPKDYDKIEWVGLEEKAKIIRIVGGAPSSMRPGSHVNPTDAHEIFVSTILDDNGKRMKLKLPLHADDISHEHIMWRIINKVNEVKWVKGVDGKSTKVNVNEQYPWFEKVNKGGFAPTDKSYQYSKGWKGQQVVIMNVIDREDNWCAENKHTKLLSKKLSGDNGEFAEIGVPSFGFCSALSNIVKSYGSWERYDVQVRRTGQKTTPIDVKQATLYKKNGLVQELDKDKLQYVSLNETLTPEELEYERYDISKFFAPTTYQKILSKLGNTIKSIDVDLRTNFYEELQALAEKEKKEFEEVYGSNAPAPEAAPAQTATVAQPTQTAPVAEAAPARTAVREAVSTPASGLTPDKIALLKGWNLLTDEEKAVIVDVIKNPDGTLADIVYNTDHPVLSCPSVFPDGSHGCGINAPDFFRTCPSCGKSF